MNSPRHLKDANLTVNKLIRFREFVIRTFYIIFGVFVAFYAVLLAFGQLNVRKTIAWYVLHASRPSPVEDIDIKEENLRKYWDYYSKHPIDGFVPILQKNHWKKIPFSFPSLFESGITLRGFFVNASDAFEEEVIPRDKIKNITVVFMHGAFTEHREMLKHASYMIRAGYDALLFDQTDHGHSDRLGKKGRGASLAVREKRDVQSAITALSPMLKKSYGKDPKFIVFGSSQGAASTLAATIAEAKRNASNICLIVCENPFSSRKEQLFDTFKIVLTHGRWSREVNALTLGLKYIGKVLPDSFIRFLVWSIEFVQGKAGQPEIIDEIPILAERKPNLPILLLHSKKDQGVLASHSERLWQKLQASGHKNSRLELFEEGAHSKIWNAQPEKFEAVVFDFLSKNIKHCE